MNFIEIEKSIKSENWSMLDLHSHSHYEIYFLTKGSRTFFLSNALYKLTAPVIVIIPPHIMHKTEGDAFERFNINVSDTYLDEFQRQTLKNKALTAISLNDQTRSEFVKIFEKIHSIDKRKKHSEHIIKSLFSYIILLISELSDYTLSPTTSLEKTVPPVVLKVIDYLNTHYSNKVTLDFLSNSFYISKGTLIYNFNKFMGCSPIDYLLNVRLTKAKELLLSSKKNIGEISEECGFSSANYFGLIFKQKENLSPANYKKYQNEKK